MAEITNTSSEERERALRLKQMAVDLIPKFDFDWNSDSQVFLRRQTLARILFLAELYELVLPIPGHILEFGCKWGSSLAMFTGLRGLREPSNFTRTIVGFDTFEGLRGVSAKDEGGGLRRRAFL